MSYLHILTTMCVLLTFSPSKALWAKDEFPNIIVMGEDADLDTVPRNSRVFRQVLQEIENSFNNNGYHYFDETALSRNFYAHDRIRRARDELCTIARTVDTPIDIAVLFSIYASTSKLDFATFARMRIEGEMLDCRSGEGLGNFEVVSHENFKLPVECGHECLVEGMSKEARPLGRDLGSALVQIVGQHWLGRPGSLSSHGTSQVQSGYIRFYNLCFDGFSQKEMIEIEKYLVVFNGYQAHRVSRTEATMTCYQYETASAEVSLIRNLRKMLEQSGYRGEISGIGADFTVERIPDRRQRKIDPQDFR